MKLIDILNEIKVKPATPFKVDPNEVLRQELLRKPMKADTIKDYKLIGYSDDQDHHFMYYDNDPRLYIRYYFQTPDPRTVRVIIFKEYPMSSEQYKYDSSWPMTFDQFNDKFSKYRINEIKVKPASSIPDPEVAWEIYLDKEFEPISGRLSREFLGYEIVDNPKIARYYFKVNTPNTSPWLKILNFFMPKSGEGGYEYRMSNNYDINAPMWQNIIQNKLTK
jgi:hypothetical protein